MNTDIKELLKERLVERKKPPVLVQLRLTKEEVAAIKAWEPSHLSVAMKIKTIILNLIEGK